MTTTTLLRSASLGSRTRGRAAGRRAPARRRDAASTTAAITSSRRRGRRRCRARAQHIVPVPRLVEPRHLAFEQVVHQCTSSSALAQCLPRSVERRADRARADRERRRRSRRSRGRRSSGERRSRAAARSGGRAAGTGACPFDDGSCGSASARPRRRASRAALTTIRQTHASSVPLAAEAPALAHRARERLLHGVATELPVARDAAATRRNSGSRER